MPQPKSDRIDLEHVSIDGRNATMLAPVTLRVERGKVTYLAAEPGHGHTALALIASGRMISGRGKVTYNYRENTTALRTATGLVDVPHINEPVDVLSVRVTAAEFLGLAGQPSGAQAVGAWLAQHGFAHLSKTLIEQLEPAERTALMAALVAADPQVKFLIFSMPDRHGGQPEHWQGLVQSYADRGYGVLVGCNQSSAQILTQRGLIAPAPDTRMAAESEMEILK